MSGDRETEMDSGAVRFGSWPEVRALVTRGLREGGNADLIEVLGLDEPAPVIKSYVVIGGRMVCSECQRPVRADGACRDVRCAIGLKNTGPLGRQQ